MYNLLEDYSILAATQVETVCVVCAASLDLLTEIYAKHTFQAPFCCYESGLAMDLLLFETINVSID